MKRERLWSKRYIPTAFIATLVLFSSSIAGVNLISSSSDGSSTTLEFTLDPYELNYVDVNGDSCTEISVDGEYTFLKEKGAPELPFLTTNIVIPNDQSVSMTVVEIETAELDVNPMKPSKGEISRSASPSSIAYEFGAAYEEDANFPAVQTSISEPFIMRDIHGAAVKFFPFQYNGATGKLTVIKKIIVEIEATGRTMRNSIDADLAPSSAFEALYENNFINYQPVQSRSESRVDAPKLVIISASANKAAMEPFVEWKMRKGFETSIFEYPSETGGQGVMSLQTFITSKYREGTTYFLLVGDNTDIPSYSASNLWSNQTGLMDPKFVMIDGNDFYQDAFIGRFPTSSASETRNLVNKVVDYEKSPTVNGTWYKKAVGIGSDESGGGASDIDWKWMNRYRDLMLSKTYSEVDKHYDPGASASGLTRSINDGRSWVNYMGHGNKTSWSTTNYRNSHVSSLSNGEKLPIVVAVACLVGKFDERDCFAETWVNNTNGGAVAFLGSTISQPWTPPQDAQSDMLGYQANSSYRTIGEIFANGEIDMVSAARRQHNSDANIATVLTWHTFGDPTMNHRNDTPSALNLNHPTATSSNFEVTGPQGTIVTIYSPDDGKMVSKEIIGSSAPFDISGFSSTEIFVTGTDHNVVPYLGTITAGTANSAPTDITLSNNTVDADATVGTLIGLFTATDPDQNDTHTFIVNCSTCDGIVSSNDSLLTSGTLVAGDHTFEVIVTDAGGLSFSKDIVITVVDVHEENVAPTDITLSNDTAMTALPSGTVIGVFSAVDANRVDSHTFEVICATCDDISLRGDTLVSNSQIKAGTLTFEVTTTDAGGLSFTKEMSITVLENPYFSLTGTADWFVGADELGSTSELAIDSSDPGSPIFTVALFRDENPSYDKWSNMTVKFKGNIFDTTEYMVTYNSESDIKFVFPMETLVGTGAGHFVKLPSTNGVDTTVYFKKSDLIQPVWAEAENLDMPITFGSIKHAYFELASQATTATTGSITVKEFAVAGFKEFATNITSDIQGQSALANIVVSSMASGGLNISVPTAGNYKVEMYSVSGRQLMSKDINLVAGFQGVTTDISMGTGMAIVRIVGQNSNFVSRIVLD